jgi:hypothetical protein
MLQSIKRGRESGRESGERVIPQHNEKEKLNMRRHREIQTSEARKK